MAGPGRFREGGFDGRMAWFKGDDGAQPGHCRPDAAPRHLYRNAPGGRDHEAQATGAALDRHRPQRPVHRDVLLRLRGGAGSRVLSSLSGRLLLRGSELVYSDPPYLMSTCKSQRRYRYHYSEADHEALLGLLRGLPCSVMISGYFSALYDRILEGCHSVSVKLPREACQRVNKSDNKTLTAAERRAVRKRYRTILTRAARSCPNSRRDRKGNADGSQSPSHATCTSASRSTKSPSCASQPTRTSASRIMPESRRSGCQRSRSRSRDASGPNSRPKPGAGSPVIWTQWRHSATILSSPSRSRSPEMPPQ